jgi:hypothetical protein
MKTLNRIAAQLRIWIGWGTLSETRVSPAHGWLLRDPSKAQLVPLPLDKGGRR